MTDNKHHEHTEADLRASLHRLIAGNPRVSIPVNFNYDDDMILYAAFSELIALRKTLPATLNDEGWSVTLTAPMDTYVYMPRPGRLKVIATLPGPPTYTVEYTDYLEYLEAWGKRYHMGEKSDAEMLSMLTSDPLTNRDCGDESDARQKGSS